MAKKSASSAAAATPTAAAASSSLAHDPLPAIKVNPANLSEIKQALDDAIRHHLAPPTYAPSHLHATVHLALGYLSVALAAWAVLYSWGREWGEGKGVLWGCTAGYFGLQSAIWAWKRWAEAGAVWAGSATQGGNKVSCCGLLGGGEAAAPPGTPSMEGGLTMEVKLRISSATTLDPPPNPAPMVRITQATCPGYVLTVSVTGLGPRELIVVAGRGVGELVDSAGGVEAGEVTRWLDGLLASAGLGKKAE